MFSAFHCVYSCLLYTSPYVQRSYPVPYSKREAVQLELDRMLAGDIIERSVSTYSNPLVVVIKKDGRVRSVSYTHLDVYKRQIVLYNKISLRPSKSII